MRENLLRAKVIAFGLITTLWATGPAVGQQRELSVDWIYSDDGAAVGKVPDHVWLEDGTALIYDAREPASRRTFERLDPATGTKKPALDMARAIASLTSIAGDVGVSGALAWPSSFDARGEKALYGFKGDIFVLTMATAEFRRVTETPDEEKDASFSPDGRQVAFVRANDLYTSDLSTRAETRITRDGAESILNGTLSWVYWEEIFGRHDTGYWWAGDSKALAYLRTDESAVDSSYFVDFTPASGRLIRQRYPTTGTTNPSVRVGIAELATQKTTWVDITDRPFEYVARVKWLPGSQQLSVQTLTRDQMELNLYFADRSGGGVTPVLTEHDPGWVNINDDFEVLKDRRHFIWASERDGFARLYRYALDGSLTNQITSGEWAIAASLGGEVYWLRRALQGIDEAGGWIYFTALEKSSIERHLYRIKLDGTGMSRVTREDGTHRISMSPDARYYFDDYSDIRTPPALRLHRADGELIATLARPRTDLLSSFDMRYPELLTIPARDGFKMPAQILKPKDFAAGRRYPVIVYIYGGPSAPVVSNAWQFYHLYSQLLIKEGFIVAQVDNRCATAISKRLENTILHRSGEPEAADIVDAVKWLRTQPYVDADRVGIWGWSGGGNMTLNAMTRSSEFKAGIAVAAVTDWHYYDTRWAEAYMKRPADNPEGYEQTSLVKRAKDLHGRLMLVFGTYDDNVHPQNSLAFMDALIANGTLFDLMVYPMRKHPISDDPAQIHLFKTMIEFWKRTL